MYPRSSSVMIAIGICAFLSGCGSSDGAGVRVTLSPSASMAAGSLTGVALLEVFITGADEGHQSYSSREDGSGPLFADGTERVVFLPRTDAQGSLSVRAIARDAKHRPLAIGSAAVPLLRGQGANLRVQLDLPVLCEDEIRDHGEGDVDCGGSCTQRCRLGASCVTPSDCAEGSCVRGQCAPAACGNSFKDGDETDLDCGGSCPRCLDGAVCIAAKDCRSAYCNVDGRCAACAQAAQCGSGEDCQEGMCKAPGATTRECTIANGRGNQDFAGNAWSSCKAASCDAGFHVAGTGCESDTRTCVIAGGSGVQTWNGSGFGACVASGCPMGQHLENGTCTSDTKTCTLTDGTGTQQWNGLSYSACTPTSCNFGYHVEGTACVSNTRSCIIDNGAGSQSWNGGGFGACMVVSCKSGYQQSGNSCAFISTAPTLSSLTPSSFPICGCQNLSFSGTNFGPSSVVYWKNTITMATATTALSYDSPTHLYLNNACFTESVLIGSYNAWVGVTTASGIQTSGTLPVTITNSAPQLLSVSPSSVATGSVYCPVFQLSSTYGVCNGAVWEAFNTASGGSPSAAQALSVMPGVPYSATTSGGSCIGLTGAQAGSTFYLGVKNPDGSASNRVAITITP